MRWRDALASGLDFGHARPCGIDGANCQGFGTGRCVESNLVFGPLSDDEMCIIPMQIYDPLPGRPPRTHAIPTPSEAARRNHEHHPLRNCSPSRHSCRRPSRRPYRTVGSISSPHSRSARPSRAPACPASSSRAIRSTAIVLRSAATRYLPVGKPSLYPRDPGRAGPVRHAGERGAELQVVSGRVSLPTLGTFPDDFSLTQVAPVAVPLKNGDERRFSYSSDGCPEQGRSSTAAASRCTTRRATCSR